jgi:hypothetical protein
MIRALQERTVRATTEDPMDHDSGVITHPKFRMWLRPDGIVALVFTSRAATDLAVARAAVEAMIQLTGGRSSPLLVDMHGSGPQDRSARSEFARRVDVVSAVALIVDTPLTRMLGTFFLTVSKPPYPTRLFDDEVSALAWLLARSRQCRRPPRPPLPRLRAARAMGERTRMQSRQRVSRSFGLVPHCGPALA